MVRTHEFYRVVDVIYDPLITLALRLLYPNLHYS